MTLTLDVNMFLKTDGRTSFEKEIKRKQIKSAIPIIDTKDWSFKSSSLGITFKEKVN